jgi:hypothetical protein
MGFKDKIDEAAQRAKDRAAESGEALRERREVLREEGAVQRQAREADNAERKETQAAREHYDVEVNKNDLNVGRMTSKLNRRWADGWRLAHVLEQNGNTVMVFERRD